MNKQSLLLSTVSKNSSENKSYTNLTKAPIRVVLQEQFRTKMLKAESKQS